MKYSTNGNSNNAIISDVELTRLDSGFFDQELFKVFESLQIGYSCGGKLYDDVEVIVSNCATNLSGAVMIMGNRFGIMLSLGIAVGPGTCSDDAFFVVLSMKISRCF
ncbi:MAG: hypothetical protein SV775_03110 [Thermodesulfobacteriota bacterium]|nr:hypothetical protein [Thermodesulfobacteriota bacterium]